MKPNFGEQKTLTNLVQRVEDPFSQKIMNAIFKVLPAAPDRMQSRESSWLELKESFHIDSLPSYSKTCAAYANTKGGYIVFGVTNKPRSLIGLKNNAFENVDPERVTEFFNAYFDPELSWEMNVYTLSDKKFGLIYIERSRQPVICRKNHGSDLREGAIYYRYRGRSQPIRYAEMKEWLEEYRLTIEKYWFGHLSRISQIGVENVGILNANSGEVSGAGGKFIIDEGLLEQVRFIKEGEFEERQGAPAIRIVGTAEVHEPSITLSSSGRKIIRRKGIRTPDIVRDFLRKRKVSEPLEYVMQICFEASAYLPVYYYLKLAGITINTAIGLIGGVQSTSRAKEKLMARLRGDDKLQVSASDTRREGQRKITYYESWKRGVIDCSTLDISHLRDILQAVRMDSEMKISIQYLRNQLMMIFDEYYGKVSPVIDDEVRRAICFIDQRIYLGTVR